MCSPTSKILHPDCTGVVQEENETAKEECALPSFPIPPTDIETLKEIRKAFIISLM